MSLAEKIIYASEEEVIALLQDYDINEWDEFGFRPLIQAVICKKYVVLQALLAAGADLEQVDVFGATPLQWACSRADFTAIKTLLVAGANPNNYSYDGKPLLVEPILGEQLEIVQLLTKYNANVAFAEDFISAKLIGHRFELTGECDIVAHDGSFIPLSYEGFYLEFSTALLSRSLNNFIHSMSGYQFKHYHGSLQKILASMQAATQLVSYRKHKDKIPFQAYIDQFLSQSLLLLPTGYQGHAISFVCCGGFWAKCDRGVHNLVDTVVIYKIGNPYALTQELYEKILYAPETKDFIDDLHNILELQPITSLPTKNQVSGNCSWANIETAVPAMLMLLLFAQQPEFNPASIAKLTTQVYRFYNKWVAWDKDSALDELLANIAQIDNHLRKLSKATMLGSIFVQRLQANKARDVVRAKKILSLLTQEQYKFILENYRYLYYYQDAGIIGANIKLLTEQLNFDWEMLELPCNKVANFQQNTAGQIKMTTALHIACMQGQLSVVKYLVEKLQLNVDYLDRTGSSGLMYAAWQGHIDIVRYLITRGANMYIKNLKGGTALAYARYAERFAVIEYLTGLKNAKY